MNEGKLRKSLKLMACFFILVVSTITYASSSGTEMESKIKGSWVSPKWNYGFRIDGMSGYATQWENKYNSKDETAEGDIILSIDEYTSSGFIGKQLFFNGKLIPVIVELIDRNTIQLVAGPEVWLMVRSPASE